MKILILFIIQIYWLLIPKQKRRKCIFKKSCSVYVYEKTRHSGFIEGLKAFWFRYKNCRGDFEIFSHPLNNSIQIILPSKLIVGGEVMADEIIKTFNHEFQISKKN